MSSDVINLLPIEKRELCTLWASHNLPSKKRISEMSLDQIRDLADQIDRESANEKARGVRNIVLSALVTIVALPLILAAAIFGFIALALALPDVFAMITVSVATALGGAGIYARTDGIKGAFHALIREPFDRAEALDDLASKVRQLQPTTKVDL